MSTISPQGYSYGKDPKADNPFWEDGDIAENLTATATVDNTTGTPAVDVTKNGYNLNFAFTGIKGEQGERGLQGEPGAPGVAGAPGKDGKSVTVTSTGSDVSGAVAGSVIDGNGNYITVYNGAQGAKGEQGEPGVEGKQGPQGEPGTPGKDGKSVTVTSTGSDVSGAVAGSVTDSDGNRITVYNGAQGERGEQGVPGPQGEPGTPGAPGKDGSDADISKCVTNVSVVNAAGDVYTAGNTYTVKQTKGDGATTGAGNIFVPNRMNSDPRTVDNAYTPIKPPMNTTFDGTKYMYLYVDDMFTFSENGHQGLTLETNISTIFPIINGQSRTVPVTITGYNSYNCSIFRAVCTLMVNNNVIESMRYRFYLMGGNYTSLAELTWSNRTEVIFKEVSTL